MLIVDGFLENGVFIPNKPLADIKGRQYATLTIVEPQLSPKGVDSENRGSPLENEEIDQQERITAWRQFGEAIINSNEELAGEPERLKFRTIDEAV